jgi:hypothetical protein
MRKITYEQPLKISSRGTVKTKIDDKYDTHQLGKTSFDTLHIVPSLSSFGNRSLSHHIYCHLVFTEVSALLSLSASPTALLPTPSIQTHT